jgi:hypothetical protein
MISNNLLQSQIIKRDVQIANAKREVRILLKSNYLEEKKGPSVI